MHAIRFIACAMLLMGCSPQLRQHMTNDDERPAERLVAANTSLAAPARQPAPDDSISGLKTQSCFLEVDGVVHIDGPCLVYPMGDTGYTLNTWSHGKPARSHFAMIVVNGDGSGDASWNRDADDDRAGDPLGTVHLKNGCWVNDRARICAR